jgi:N-acetylglutamate synthase
MDDLVRVPAARSILARANLKATDVSDTNMPDFLPLSPDDPPDVIDLWSQTEGVGLNESDSPKALAAFLIRNPGLSRVACDGQTIVAALLCGHDGRRGFLYHLAVKPAYRRQGLGKALVEQCLSALAKQGIQKCNALIMPRLNASGGGSVSASARI